VATPDGGQRKMPRNGEPITGTATQRANSATPKVIFAIARNPTWMISQVWRAPLRGTQAASLQPAATAVIDSAALGGQTAALFFACLRGLCRGRFGLIGIAATMAGLTTLATCLGGKLRIL
jgi:hypothetical protein